MSWVVLEGGFDARVFVGHIGGSFQWVVGEEDENKELPLPMRAETFVWVVWGVVW